jgi:uncharacterized protein YuzE
MKQNFEYNAEVDSLYIYSDRAEKEEVAGSIVVGNLTFDISNNGNFVGLEIDNASKVFQLSMKLLPKLQGAELTTSIQGNIILLGFMIKLDNKEYNFSYMVPKNKITLTT